QLPLRMLLKFGRIRPVDRPIALHLYGLTGNEKLRKILDAWAEDQWELWDLIDLLAETGYNPKRFWKAIAGDYEHICRVVLPEHWRLYSISSTMNDAPDELHLTVGSLNYQTTETPVSHQAARQGTGSGFLARLTDERVSIKVVHPSRFSLPEDVTRPVVLIAGGTGIAPMRSLIAERMRQPNAGATWLFFGTRRREDFYYQAELEPLIASGRLHVRVAFSQDDVTAEFNPTTRKFEFIPAKRQHLDHEMVRAENAQILAELLKGIDQGGSGGYFYVCGRTAFAGSVMNTIRQILNDPHAFYRLIGEDRLMLEIFTTYAGAHFDETKRQYNVSDVVLHNNEDDGYWIIINGRVYDVNEFNHIHPGGAKIVQSYSGMDGTIAYQKVDHHMNPEVDAMLGMYELGVIQMPDFGQVWGVALSAKGIRMITLRNAYAAWVDFLYMVVEIENAIASDFRIQGEPLTDIETFDHVVLTASKVQQLALTHERLVTSYLSHVLGEPIEALWAL
ncbi:MAG TPA: cytochrome b5 domain-containing protein, partial [Phototrophicaceae bacterium]|nr:cytochrome b5 domain-containing protein [Phototrophicaceae bacterium]